MAAPEWFPTRRRFDDILDALHKANETVHQLQMQHTYDLALIARLEAELAARKLLPVRHRRGD